MIYLATISLALQLMGIFTSVSVIGIGQALFVIPLVFSVRDAIKNKNLAIPKSAYWLIAFILIAILSLMINAEYVPKLSRNLKKLKYPLLGVTSIYFFRYWLRESSLKMKTWVANLFLASIIIAALYGITTFYTNGLSRINGFTDTMRYGYGTAMFLLVMLGLLFKRKQFNWFDQKLLISAIVFSFIAMTLTYTRGAMLGFICALPFTLYFYKRKIGIIFMTICFALGLTMSGYYLFGKENTHSRFLITKNNSSDSVRRSVWESAIYAIKERPLTGWGYYNFHSQMKRIKNEYDIPHKEYSDAHSHNILLEIWAGTGLFGIIAFLGWVITWALESFKTPLGRSLIVPLGMAWLISSQFEVTLDTNNSTMIYLLYALSTCFDKKVEQENV